MGAKEGCGGEVAHTLEVGLISCLTIVRLGFGLLFRSLSNIQSNPPSLPKKLILCIRKNDVSQV